MSIASYIKVIGRGSDGARSLDREQALDLMSQVLDGRVTDLEVGAFALAMRIKGETVDELAGFLAAAEARCIAIRTDRPTVVLPSYNGARRLPNLTALLAMLLAQHDVQVLVHGPVTTRPGHHRGDLPRPRPDLRQRRRRHRRGLGAPRAGVHPRPRRCARRWRGCSRCARSSACATPATPSPSCSPGAAARRHCASSTTRTRSTRRCSPASSAHAAPTRCSCAAPRASRWPTRAACNGSTSTSAASCAATCRCRAGRHAAPAAGAAAQQRRGDDRLRDPGDGQRRDAGAGAVPPRWRACARPRRMGARRCARRSPDAPRVGPGRMGGVGGPTAGIARGLHRAEVAPSTHAHAAARRPARLSPRGAGAHADLRCRRRRRRRRRLLRRDRRPARPRVLLIDHAEKVAEKIRISGGGRCNFTNRDVGASNFPSTTPTSAARRWRATRRATSSRWSNGTHRLAREAQGPAVLRRLEPQIIDMLLAECGRRRRAGSRAGSTARGTAGFELETARGGVARASSSRPAACRSRRSAPATSATARAPVRPPHRRAAAGAGAADLRRPSLGAVRGAGRRCRCRSRSRRRQASARAASSRTCCSPTAA